MKPDRAIKPERIQNEADPPEDLNADWQKEDIEDERRKPDLGEIEEDPSEQ